MRLTALLCLAAGSAAAHTVTVDGNANEWSARTLPFHNLGIVARSAGPSGEYVFDDAPGDQRTDLGPALNLDIVSFHVSADAAGLYFLIRVAQAGPLTPQFQISIDTDR